MTIPDPTILFDWFNDPKSGGDPATRSIFLHRYPDFIDLMSDIARDQKKARMPLKVLPPLNEITALQVNLIDNWPTGKKEPYRTFRYALTVQAWTCPADKVVFAKDAWDMNFIGDLRTLDEVRDRHVTIQKNMNKPSDDYFRMAEAIGENCPGAFLTMLEGKGKAVGGTVFPDHNMIATTFSRDTMTATAEILIGDQFLPFAPFVTTNAAGKPLNDGRWKTKTMSNGKSQRLGLPILQSRYSTDPRLANWSTNQPTNQRKAA